MKNLKHLFALCLFTLAIGFSACDPAATTITVTGKVTDGTNSLEGVTVTASSGATTSTDASGDYSIAVDPNGNLTYTSKGYTTKKMDVSNQTSINIELSLDAWVATFASNNNSVMDPNFQANSIIPTTNLTSTSPTGAWYSSAPYKGAIDATASVAWYNKDNWSFYSRIIAGNTTSATLPTANKPVKTITDAWMQNQGTTVTWTPDTVYVLSGFVFVANGQTLNIDAGTVVQGEPGVGANASALIVARGGKIMANGTSTDPIVFTFKGDNGGTAATRRGEWGGLILLGKAGLNSSPGETQIEGIPTSETRGLYGGTDDADNSGVLRYVSIRHGGSNIGNDNEINGLTLGGVGTGTTIEYVEVVGNKDDGIEWFGGTVNAKWLLSIFCGDDALDYDEGYRGMNQFVIVHQDPALADRGGEHDGGTTPETATPYATPKFWNVTSVGNSASRTITFRDNAGGHYHNSIFTGYGRGIDVEDLLDQEQDSHKQVMDGNLKVKDCVFFNIGAGTTAVELFTVTN